MEPSWQLPQRKADGLRDRCSFHCTDTGIFRRVGRLDTLLREPARRQGRPVMNWVYWLSGLASLGIFIYLLIALFKPELFS
jgi:K+-transporting ATPase KdpF subunit